MPLTENAHALQRDRELTRAWSFGLRSLRTINIAVQRMLLRKRYFERRIHDYRLLLDSHDPGINRQLLQRGMREPEQRFILEAHLEPGMHAFDLGANIGYYTLMMARSVGARGCVYAVEPHPDNYALLSKNVARNETKNVELENVAIDVVGGERALLIAERCNWHSFHDPIVTDEVSWKRHYQRTMKTAVMVRTRALATFLESKPRLDLLRMDLEGYEVEILSALADVPTSLTRKLHILFETHPEFYHPHRHDIRSVLAFLHERHGYRVKYLVSDFQNGSRRHRHIEPGRVVFQRHGYGSKHIVKAFHNRAIYAGMELGDAVDLICTSENVHAAFLEPV
jgi:FkbM family methyltransferase